eukprot:UN02244
MKANGDDTNAKITLADCLACSGCVTTAESVLIAQHSSTRLLEVLNNIIYHNSNNSDNINVVNSHPDCTYKEVVISISLPSLLSLSALFNVSAAVMYDLLAIWFSTIGVSSTLYALEAQVEALSAAAHEFDSRFRQLAQKNDFPLPPPTLQSNQSCGIKN